MSKYEPEGPRDFSAACHMTSQDILKEQGQWKERLKSTPWSSEMSRLLRARIAHLQRELDLRAKRFIPRYL